MTHQTPHHQTPYHRPAWTHCTTLIEELDRLQVHFPSDGISQAEGHALHLAIGLVKGANQQGSMRAQHDFCAALHAQAAADSLNRLGAPAQLARNAALAAHIAVQQERQQLLDW